MSDACRNVCRRFASRRVVAFLIVGVVARVDGRSRVVKRLSALDSGRSGGSSRSSRSSDRRAIIALWVMTLVGVDIQKVAVAAVVCMESIIVQSACDIIGNAAGEEAIGEHEIGDGHIDESKS